jgi:hypothetical protein
MALMADEAFELGCLFQEALTKFRWDDHAKRGEKTVNAAKEGGRLRRNANPRRKDPDETFAAVEALLPTMSLSKAYAVVAKQQGVSVQTIRKEFRRTKKQR